MGYIRKNKKRGSKTYTYMAKSYRANGKVKTHDIFISERDKADKILNTMTTRPLKNETFYSYSGEKILSKLARDLTLANIINKHVKNNTTVNCGQLMEYLIIERALNPCSKWELANKIHNESYFSIEGKIDLNQFTEDNIYNHMDYLYPHIHEIHIDIIKRLQSRFDIKFEELILDATSIYFFIEDHDSDDEPEVDLVVTHGYNRDHRPDLKQINLMIGVNKDYIPLFFESFSGNTSDYEMFQKSLNLLGTKYKRTFKSVKKRYIVIDNGNISEGKFKTVEDLDKFCKTRNTFFVAGLKKVKVESELRSTTFDTTKDPIYQSGKTKIYGKLIKKEIYGKFRDILLCFNTKVEKRQKESFKLKIEKARSKIKEINNNSDISISTKKERIEAYLKKKGILTLFNRKTKLRSISCTLIQKEKNRRLSLCGKNAIFSNDPKLDPKEMIHIYKTKSKVEHEFRLLKHLFCIRSINHRKAKRIKSHVAIVMWGMLLTSLLKYILKTQEIKYSFEEIMHVIKKGGYEVGLFEHPDLNKILKISRPKYISDELKSIFSRFTLNSDELDIKEIAPTDHKK